MKVIKRILPCCISHVFKTLQSYCGMINSGEINGKIMGMVLFDKCIGFQKFYQILLAF